MFEVNQTETFRAWRTGLRDQRLRGLIASRLDRLANGHFGDARPVGEGVAELRLHFGPGYRLYYCRRGASVIVLLCGGDKGSQAQDIALAKRLAKEEGDPDG
jgi:putative addiction module killer protein